jgi:hypothetical protein
MAIAIYISETKENNMTYYLVGPNSNGFWKHSLETLIERVPNAKQLIEVAKAEGLDYAVITYKNNTHEIQWRPRG